MASVVFNMLCFLAIVILGFLIIAAIAVEIYAILYVVYKFFLKNTDNTDNDGKGEQE